MLTFVDFPDEIEVTNNGCERALRGAVIQRKVTSGLRDDGGWVRSTSKIAGYYFIYYLNGADRYPTLQDRYYVNVLTGKVSR